MFKNYVLALYFPHEQGFIHHLNKLKIPFIQIFKLRQCLLLFCFYLIGFVQSWLHMAKCLWWRNNINFIDVLLLVHYYLSLKRCLAFQMNTNTIYVTQGCFVPNCLKWAPCFLKIEDRKVYIHTDGRRDDGS